jgi:release factor glutamine methyltransferase
MSTRPASAQHECTTIATALQEARNLLEGLSETPKLDAEVLLARVLNRDRSYLRAWPERTLSPDEFDRFQDLVQRRQSGTPVAYLFGEKEFWSRTFKVRPDVLIPRPETELLVDLALTAMAASQITDILDLGTGSGAIAITIAAERPFSHITATDLSPEALKVAQENADRLGVRNIRFQLGNWFDAVASDGRFDLIVSNPPYVADDDPHLSRGDVRFEPSLALKGGLHGLDALRIIARDARDHLNPNGHLILEHGFNQANAVADLLGTFGYTEIRHHQDLQGHFRVTTARQ